LDAQQEDRAVLGYEGKGDQVSREPRDLRRRRTPA